MDKKAPLPKIAYTDLAQGRGARPQMATQSARWPSRGDGEDAPVERAPDVVRTRRSPNHFRGRVAARRDRSILGHDNGWEGGIGGCVAINSMSLNDCPYIGGITDSDTAAYCPVNATERHVRTMRTREPR